MRTLRLLLAIKPWHTWRIVLLSLLSQIGIIIAFVLPLKVIMMLGSDRIPRYFPEWFQEFPREQLIYSLSAIALTFYIISLTAEHLTSKHLESFSRYLVERADKITTLPNENELARSAYAGLVNGLSGIIFFFVAGTAIGFLYPNLLMVLAVFLFVTTALTFGLSWLHRGFHRYVAEHLASYLDGAYAVGFLSMFGFVVADYLLPIEPPGLIYALFGFVLGRQLLAGAGASIRQLANVHGKQRRIEGLFFQGHAAQTDTQREVRFWSMLEPDTRDQWILSAVEEASGATLREGVSRWRETGATNVAAFEVETKSEPDGESGTYLLRIFDVNKKSQAASEEAILRLPGLPPFAPKFEGAVSVGNYQIHVLNWPDMQPYDGAESRQILHAFNSQLMATSLEREFVDRYSRTRPYLWQRITGATIRRLRIAAEPESAADLERLSHSLTSLSDALEALPLQLLLPKIAAEDLASSRTGEPVLSAWTNWRIEPIGAGWSVNGQDSEQRLRLAIGDAAKERPDLACLDEESVRLAAMVYQFERLFLSQKLTLALNAIPGILSQLERCAPPRRDRQDS